MGLIWGTPAIEECPADTVQLFQFSRGPFCPSMSPFPLKLETYLRMAKIPYQNDLHSRMSSKSKIPWMRYNGQEISDSALCIDFLKKERGVDLSKHLSKEEKAIARAFQRMIDDVMYWEGVYYRWVTDDGFKMNLIGFGDNWMIKYYVRPMLKKQCHAQGTSRNSPEEIKQMSLADLEAIENYLGDKPYLMGDQPTEVDASLFGLTAQLMWQISDEEAKKFIPEHCPKIAQFCERMKKQYWPDWDECITHGGTKKATK